MSSTISNTTAFNAYTNYTLNNLNLNSVMRKLATGVKGVVDDGAGVAISERMKVQANSTAKARNNADNAISLLQTADTWMQQMGDLVAQMHSLAVDSGDATKTSTDRSNIQAEFSGLQAELTRITSNAAKFNNNAIFDSAGNFQGTATQIGADNGQVISIDIKGFSSGLNITGATWGSVATDISVSLASTATNSQSVLANAINFIAQQRASIGAQQGRFEKTRSGLLSYEDQIRSAESKIRSVDTARESSEMMKYQILSQIGTAMLAQANQLPAAAVQLVG